MSLLNHFKKVQLNKKSNPKSRGPRKAYTYRAVLTSIPPDVYRELKLLRNYESVAYEVPRTRLIKNLEVGLLNHKSVAALINKGKLQDYALLVDRVELDFDTCFLTFLFKGHGQVEYIVHEKGGEVIYQEVLPKLQIEDTDEQSDEIKE